MSTLNYSSVAREIDTIIGVIGLAGLLAGVYSFIRFKNYNETVRLQNDNIKALLDRVDLLQTELNDTKTAHTEATKSIAQLQGQLKSYKEIPLQEISTSLSKLADGYEAISKGLNNIQNMHVNTQVVDKQTLKGKK